MSYYIVQENEQKFIERYQKLLSYYPDLPADINDDTYFDLVE